MFAIPVAYHPIPAVQVRCPVRFLRDFCASSQSHWMTSSAYFAVKFLHVACVVLSLAGFAARGALMLGRSPLLQVRFVRVAPHVVDTALLASAAWLSWFIAQYPFVHAWLTAKVLALVGYIVLGSVALRRGPTKRMRAAAFGAALALGAYIVAVALARDPRGPLAWLVR
jgi:uncharacterized membrane protein SirB2